MSDVPAPRKRGRPPVPAADRKDGNLTFRTRAGLREKLAEAAEAADRSISEEIERRLERSFEADERRKAAAAKTLDAIELSFGGEQMTRFAMDLTYALRQAIGRERATIEDFQNKSAVRQAVLNNFSEILPHQIEFTVTNTHAGTKSLREMIMIMLSE